MDWERNHGKWGNQSRQMNWQSRNGLFFFIFIFCFFFFFFFFPCFFFPLLLLLSLLILAARALFIFPTAAPESYKRVFFFYPVFSPVGDTSIDITEHRASMYEIEADFFLSFFFFFLICFNCKLSLLFTYLPLRRARLTRTSSIIESFPYKVRQQAHRNKQKRRKEVKVIRLNVIFQCRTADTVQMCSLRPL